MFWGRHTKQRKPMMPLTSVNPVIIPEKYPLLYGLYEGSDPNDPDYGRSIATLAGNLLYTQRDYLDPIPRQQIRLNPQLTQNPGW